MSLAAVYMLDFIQIVQNVKKRLMDDVLRILRILHKRLHNVKHQPFVPRIDLGKFIFVLRRIDHCKIDKHFLTSIRPENPPGCISAYKIHYTGILLVFQLFFQILLPIKKAA